MIRALIVSWWWDQRINNGFARLKFQSSTRIFLGNPANPKHNDTIPGVHTMLLALVKGRTGWRTNPLFSSVQENVFSLLSHRAFPHICLGFVEVADSRGCVAVCKLPEVWQIISLHRFYRLNLRGNCIYPLHAVPSWGRAAIVYTYHSFSLNEEIDFSLRVGVHEYVRMRKISSTLIVGSLIAFYADIYGSQALAYPGSLVFLWYSFYDPWGFQAPLTFFPLNLNETQCYRSR